MMTKGKRISIQEFANHFKVTRETMNEWKKEFESKGYKYDPYNPNSIFMFYGFILKKRQEKIDALKII